MTHNEATKLAITALEERIVARKKSAETYRGHLHTVENLVALIVADDAAIQRLQQSNETWSRCFTGESL